MYLLDTDTLCNLLMSKPSFSLLSRLKELRRKDQYTSAIAVEELVFQAYTGPRPDHHISQLNQLLIPNLRVLAFDHRAALRCGKLRADLGLAKTELLERDLKTASICLVHDLILVTNRHGPFSKIPGLRVEKWIDD